MKKNRSVSIFTAAICSAVMVFSSFPASAAGGATVSDYTELMSALGNPAVEDISLSADITATSNIVFNVSADRTVTIDGNGHKITGPDVDNAHSWGLKLTGTATIYLDNLTLKGGTATGNFGVSYGLFADDSVIVTSNDGATRLTAIGGTASSGTSFGVWTENTARVTVKDATGGTGNYSNGIYHTSTETIIAATATGGPATTTSTGAHNQFIGSINVGTATGGSAGSYSYGVFNNVTGTITAQNATGGTATTKSYGVYNNTGGTISVTNTAQGGEGTDVTNGESYGVYNNGAGTVTAGSAIAEHAGKISFGILNHMDGDVTVDFATGKNSNKFSAGAKNEATGTITINNTARGDESELTYGVWNVGSGSISVASAYAGDNATNSSYGIYNAFNGTVTGDDCYGGSNVPKSFGAYNKENGSITVNSAYGGSSNGTDDESYGAYNAGTGTLTVNTLAQGGDTGETGYTYGVYNYASGTVNVKDAVGGNDSLFSYGIYNNGINAVIYAENATGGNSTVNENSECAISYGVYNGSVGKIYVSNLISSGDMTGTNSESYGAVTNTPNGLIEAKEIKSGNAVAMTVGAYNNSNSTINAGKITSGNSSENNSYGVWATANAIVNAGIVKAGNSADCNSYAIILEGNGTVNAISATAGTVVPNNGFAYGAYVSSVNGIINVETATGSTNSTFTATGTINTGAAIARVLLNKDATETCILDYIVVSKTGNTSFGILPTVSKAGVTGKWFTDTAKTTEFNATELTASTTLYSTHYVASGNGGNTGNTGNTGGSGNTGGTGSTGGTTSAPSEPQISGGNGATGWASIADEASSAAAGNTVKVTMNDLKNVPASFLEKIKGKDVNVEFNMGGYTWTLNGKDINAENLKDIDLSLSTSMNFISQKLVDDLRGSNNVIQLHLNYDGPFGFRAKLKENFGASNSGKYANLFYFNPQTGKFEYISSGLVGGDGFAGLDFTHASDYAVVITDKIMTSVSKTASIAIAVKSPKTGTSLPAPMAAIAIIACGAILASHPKKKD